MKFISSLSPIAASYDAFLLDLWGCVHDGSALYPGAHECLARLKDRGKKIIFLSNAPRRVPKVTMVLDMLGIAPHLYDGVMTSGEAGWHALRADAGYPMLEAGKKVKTLLSNIRHPAFYYFIGPERDADVLDGLDFTPVDAVEKADFVLNVGFGSEAQSGDAWSGVLAAAQARGLPMLCLNPDMEVVKITGERFPCAGVIARDYERMGGRVAYFGKPYGEVYRMSLEMLGGADASRVLAVGDGLHTDILGARNAGLDSALVTGGILKQELGEVSEAELRAHLAAQEVQPDYVMAGLVW